MPKECLYLIIIALVGFCISLIYCLKEASFKWGYYEKKSEVLEKELRQRGLKSKL